MLTVENERREFYHYRHLVWLVPFSCVCLSEWTSSRYEKLYNHVRTVDRLLWWANQSMQVKALHVIYDLHTLVGFCACLNE